MMTTDFLIGAIRASKDLHPQVKTELEEILNRAEPKEPKRVDGRDWTYCPCCGIGFGMHSNFCGNCGQAVKWE